MYSYRGEKLSRQVPAAKRQRSTRDVLISTVYDRPDEEQSTEMRSAPPTTIKYRDPVKFVASSSLRPQTELNS